ncbi:hypothetical protein [Lysobacter sp. Root690]|uniref:M23 family metallopeptidase n=1 Tax=Lysobacter sp. Root690 TaxID=1736588 RepID=UPI000B101CEA|nr:hypothetical protein [Lysobacter sp. Root690]
MVRIVKPEVDVARRAVAMSEHAQRQKPRRDESNVQGLIAEMGRSGAARDMLHFEVRYNAKPVDPLLYLPAK